MYIELIRNFVLRNSYYNFNYKNYYFPRHIYTVGGGIKLDLEIVLNNSLHRSESSYSIKFREDIKSLRKSYGIFSNYIREFPVIIEDRDLWDNILNYVGVRDKKLENTNYFLLDFFFQYLGVIVEIDSEYHDNKNNYDIARDIYIKRKFGLDTIRFYKYGNNNLERSGFFSKFKKISTDLRNYYNSWGIRESMYPMNFSQTMVNNFIRDNRLPLEVIDKIINYIGENKFIYSDFLSLSIQDFNKIDSNLFPGLKNYEPGTIEQLLLDNITSILLKVYGKRLTIF